MPLLPVARPEDIGLDPARLQRAYDLLDQWTRGADAPVPGGAILVGRNGKTVAARRFGKQGPEPEAEPMRADSVFLLASISKPFTYLAGLMLVERGLLNLSDPVAQYIPEFAAHHKEDTLVLHLFTHTSGLPDMLENNEELRRQHAPLSRFVQGAIRDTVPLFPAGTRLSYQSMGTLVVAELVQRLSRKSIHEFLQTEIFTPLGLTSTKLGSTGLDRARLVRVQTPEFHQPEFGWNSRYWQELGSPWGGMFSPPEEFAVLCQLLLNGGEYNGVRLLSRAAVRQMTTNRLLEQPGLPEVVGRTQPWGLGWRLNHPATDESWGDLLGPQVFGHTGATGTTAWMDPETNGFCLLFTSAIRARAPWRLVHLSNIIASAFV